LIRGFGIAAEAAMMPTLLVSNPAKPKEKRARPAWAAEMRSFVRQRRRGCGASLDSHVRSGG
jgi:hypothetical protein